MHWAVWPAAVAAHGGTDWAGGLAMTVECAEDVRDAAEDEGKKKGCGNEGVGIPSIRIGTVLFV